MEWIFTYHPAWLLLTTIVAAGLTVLLYNRDHLLEEVQTWVKWLLGASRFIYIWCIMFLLLGLIMESFEDRKEKPLIFFAHDNSESVLLTADSNYYRSDYVADLEDVTLALEEKYEVVKYSFADALEDGLKSDYSGKTTNISDVFESIFDQYTNRNIGAVVLSTDGIYNVGSNPIYSLARKNYVPVFTIGLGDTSTVRDIQIDEIKHNDIAFLGNQFPVEVVFSGTECIGERTVVSVFEGDRLIERKEHTFTRDKEQLTFNYVMTADRIGFRKYTVKVDPISDEFSLKNNTANFYIEVIDGRQKILLAHSGPHPDINALRYVIENNKNYEVVAQDLKEVDELKPYDLVVVHNYQKGNNVIDRGLEEGSVPFLMVVGTSTDTRALARKKIGFTGTGGQTEEVGFAHNPSFKEILVEPSVVQLFTSAPPLHAPFGNFSFSGGIEVLAWQKVGNIQLDNPLIYFTKKGNNRMGVIMGEGFWRWRLYDQLKYNNTKNFEQFFNKLITFLAVKENKDPFRIKIGNEYFENENVLVEAELYNKSFDLINDPEVSFEYTNEAGKTFESYFVRQGSSYRLDLGKMEEGIYTWVAQTAFQDKKYKKTGTFLVKEVKLEQLNARADHRLLNNLADNSGGAFYLPNQLSQLQSDIENREDLVTVVYQERSFVDLIDKKWIFILILFFIGLEWFIRKYQGAY